MLELLATTPVIVALFVIVSVVTGKYEAPERPYLWASFIAHQLSALAMVVLTRDYYEGGDMLAYSFFGSLNAARLRDDFFGHGAALLDVFLQREGAAARIGDMSGSTTGSMHAVSAFLMLIFNDSLSSVCAAIAGGAFLAKLAIYDMARHLLPLIAKRRLLIACLLIPSAVFWSSGLLKEPIAMLGLGATMRGAYLIVAAKRRVRALTWIFCGALVVALLKPYLLPPVGLGAGFWYTMQTLRRRSGAELLSRTRSLILATSLALAAVIVTGAVAPYLAPENLAEEAMKLQAIGARVEGGSSYTLGSAGATSLAGQLSLVPMAIATALLRPAIFEATNPLIFVNSLEMLIITLLLASVLLRRGLLGTLRTLATDPALLFCAVFVLTLSIGVGLTATNLGTLSRYRMPLMPFFGILLAALLVREERRTARVADVSSRVIRSAAPWRG
jgi:hypothetical protein